MLKIFIFIWNKSKRNCELLYLSSLASKYEGSRERALFWKRCRITSCIESCQQDPISHLWLHFISTVAQMPFDLGIWAGVPQKSWFPIFLFRCCSRLVTHRRRWCRQILNCQALYLKLNIVIWGADKILYQWADHQASQLHVPVHKCIDWAVLLWILLKREQLPKLD